MKRKKFSQLYIIQSNFWICLFFYIDTNALRRNSLNNFELRKFKFKDRFFSILENSKMSENQFKKFKSLKKKTHFFYKMSTFTHSQTYEPFTLKRNFSLKKNRFFEKKSIRNNSETTLSSYSIHLFTSQILKRKAFQKKGNEPYFLILNFKENSNLFFSFNLVLGQIKHYKFRFAKAQKTNLKWSKKENILTFWDSNQSFGFRWAIFFFNPLKINSLASQNFVTSIKKKKMFNDNFLKRNAFSILNLIKIIQNYSTLYKNKQVQNTKLVTINNIKPSQKVLRPQFKQFCSSSFFRIQFLSVIKSPVLLSENNSLVIPKSSKKQAMRLTFNKIKEQKSLNLGKLSFLEKVFKKTDFYKNVWLGKAEPAKLSFSKFSKFNKEINKNRENNYLLSFFLKSTFFSFFTNYSIFIKNRKIRWQSSIPFLNQQIHRFLFFYQRIPFFSETLKLSSFDISKRKNQNFQFENTNDFFFTLILFNFTKVSDSETSQRNKTTEVTFLSKEDNGFDFYLMNSKIRQNSFYFSKLFSKEKKTLNISLAIFIESYTQTSLINSGQIDWSYFYFEVKDQINLRDLRSFNLFLFNEFLDWSKNQHKNQPNSWIFKKYWLFVENNSKFSYTPFVLDSLKKESGIKKAHKLEGYLCLKRFFSNFGNVKENKKTRLNENSSLKKTKMHLKTWYLKKYKKKKISLKLHRKNLWTPSFYENFGFEKVCSYNIARMRIKKMKLASLNYYQMRLLFLTKNGKKNSLALFLKIHKKVFLNKKLLRNFNLIENKNWIIKNKTVWKEQFLLLNFLDQYT